MEVRRYLSIVRRRLILVVLIVAASITAGWLITPRQTEYTATSTLYVGGRTIDVDPQSGEISGNRALGIDRLIATFTALVQSRPIAAAAIEEGDVERSPSQVVASTSAEQVTGTDLLAVSVTDRDPIVAQVLANSVAEAFVSQIRELEPPDVTTDKEVVDFLERARTPSVPNSTPLIRNLSLAALVGVVLAGAVIALLEHLDITLRSADDVERRLELPVLGIVPALGESLPATPAAKVSTLPSVERSGRGTTVG